MSSSSDLDKLIQYFIIYFEDSLAQFPFEQAYDVRENWYSFRDLIKKKPINFHEIHKFVKDNMSTRKQAKDNKATIPGTQPNPPNQNHKNLMMIPLTFTDSNGYSGIKNLKENFINILPLKKKNFLLLIEHLYNEKLIFILN